MKLLEEPKIDMRRLERNLEPELEKSMQTMGSNIKSIMSSIVSTPKRHSSSTTPHKSSKSSKKDREHKDHKHSSKSSDNGGSRKLSHASSSMSSSTSSIASCSSSEIVKNVEKAPFIQQNLIIEAIHAVKAQEIIEEVVVDPMVELLVPEIAAETEIVENYEQSTNFAGDSEIMDVASNEEVAENLVIEEMVVDQDGTQIIIQPATKYLHSDEMPKKPTSTKSNGSKQKSANDLLSSIMASMDK